MRVHIGRSEGSLANCLSDCSLGDSAAKSLFWGAAIVNHEGPLPAEQKAWREVLSSVEALWQLVRHYHFLSSDGKEFVCARSRVPVIATALARATCELRMYWDDHDEERVLDSVARLAIALGNGIQGGVPLMFGVACLLLSVFRFELGSDVRHIRDEFAQYVRSGRVTDMVELLRKHWKKTAE